MLRRNLFTAGTAALAGAALGGGLPLGPAAAHPGHSPIPDIEVLDQDGQSHRFYADLVKDRVVLINFFFTSCGDTCPLVTQNLRQVQDLLGERMGRDVFLYSVSLQPALETPAILKDYAGLWDIGPGWRFLTGQPDAIERLRRAMGFASADPDYDLVLDNHTGILRYGNARCDRWAATPALARPAWIVKAVSSIAGFA
jgi:protein SCO1/2